MAPDVERALIQIVAEQRSISEERATEYLVELQRDRRYQKDVY